MDFIEKLSKTLGDAADKASKETDKLTKVAKLKYRISELEKSKNEYYKTLGLLKYSELTGTEVTDEEYASVCDEITLICKKLEVLKKRASDLESYIPCPQCGFRVKKGTAVCPVCDYVIIESAAEEPEPEPEETTEKDIFED